MFKQNLDWRELAKVQMKFSEVTEVVINSTEIFRRSNAADIRERSTRLLGASPVMMDLEKVTVDLMGILKRTGSIYQSLANENGVENTQYINSICEKAGNPNRRWKTLCELSQV